MYLNGTFKATHKNIIAGSFAGGDAKETEAFGEYFGTMNKKRVHKGETEALGNRSKIFREKKELLQRSVLKKPFTKTFT